MSRGQDLRPTTLASSQTFFEIELQLGMDLPPSPDDIPLIFYNVHSCQSQHFWRLPFVRNTVFDLVVFRNYRLKPSMAFVM